MFTAPNNINDLVHSELELSVLKISGIQARGSLSFKLNLFGDLQQSVNWGTFALLKGAVVWFPVKSRVQKSLFINSLKIRSGDQHSKALATDLKSKSRC